MTRFRVWAPEARTVELVIENGVTTPMTRGEDGYHSCRVVAPAGTRYRFRLDGGEPLPDLASRFQPEGPHGPSQVVDPSTFEWHDADWRGVEANGHIVYEMHVGTFTPEGTWCAAAEHLPDLARLGITVVEMMPVAAFPGRFGWGYDGVLFFAPTHQYGTPDDLRAFVDRAHTCGIGVILDVVYNHAGPDGNWFRHYSPHYFGRMSEWGDSFNFDGASAAFVREFFALNAACWIREFHMDGLRLDATQQIFDDSHPHIIHTIAEAARGAANGRAVWITGENEPQQASLLRASHAGGYGIDALWNDDFHHAAYVVATGHREAYYSDYQGTAQELVSCALRGFLYQGQRSSWQGKPRGSDTTALPARAFIAFLQNHDQIANSLDGRRLHAMTSPSLHRALTTLLLLGPWTPLLFQGDEFCASSPFVYFADHHADLARDVARGRLDFLSQFPSIREATRETPLIAPGALETFAACKLDHAERDTHRATWQLHHDLIRLRRTHAAFLSATHPAGAVIGGHAFVLRCYGPGSPPTGGDRLLVVNLDRSPLTLPCLSEPLLAPPDQPWKVILSSDDPAYGGSGHSLVAGDEWVIPPESATVLA